MGFCFLCNSKMSSERTRVCSSITPHSNVPYPEKLAELVGEDFVVIVTPSDHVCRKCTSLLTHMDKLEQDIKLVKNSIVSYIQKKHGMLPADQPIKTLDIVNGHLKTDDLGIYQKKVPSGLNIRGSTMNSQSKMSKPQPSDNASKIKIYKCGFCSFQSKELGHVRFHMRSHMNKTNEVEPTNQVGSTAVKTLAPQGQNGSQQKKRLFRCQVCSLSFDSRGSCLEHIQKTHNNQNATTAHEKKETGEIPLKTPQMFLSEMKTDNNQQAQNDMYANQKQKAQTTSVYVGQNQQAQTNMYVGQNQQAQTNMYVGQNQQAQTNMYVDQSQQAQTNMYVDQNQQSQTNLYVEQNQQVQTNMYVDQNQQAQTNMYVNQSQQDNSNVNSYNMLLNDNIPSERTIAQQENTQSTVQEMLSVQGAALHVDQFISNVNRINIGMDCGVNRTDDLDLESMLAAMHNDA